jgi:hypothetical protein
MNDQELKETHDNLDRVIFKCAQELADPDSNNEIGKENNISFIMIAASDTKLHLDDPIEEHVRLHVDRAKQIVLEIRKQAGALESKQKFDMLMLAESLAQDYGLEDVEEAIKVEVESIEKPPKQHEISVEEELSSDEDVSPKKIFPCEGESPEVFLIRVERRAKELYAASNQGSWDDLGEKLQKVWINSAKANLEGKE